MQYTWTNEAYAKVAFHSAKYLSHTLCGLLLGHVSNSEIQIVDAMPLFHSQLLAPTMEMALLSVDDYATKHGLTIVGVYSAPSMSPVSASDFLAPGSIQKVASKLKGFCEGAVIFLVHERITQSDQAPVGRMQKVNAEGAASGDAKQNFGDVEALRSLLASSFKSQLHLSIVDYDEYIDDPAQDWTNSTLFPKNKKE